MSTSVQLEPPIKFPELSKLFETLQAETTRHYTKDLWKKIGCDIDDVGPRPL